jgi:cytochrome b
MSPNNDGTQAQVIEDGASWEIGGDVPAISLSGRNLVWDWPVRLFHAALIVSILTAFVTNRLGVSYFKYHLWSGYSVTLLVSFRILWGLVGTRHARFWNFVRGPFATWRYAQDLLKGRDGHHPGHNPLGAVMVLLLLAALAVQALTGLVSNDEICNAGPLVGYLDNSLSLRLTSLHRLLFWGIALAVVLHLAAVLYHQLVRRENLVKAMITGRKPHHLVGYGQAITSSRSLLAVLLFAALALILFWVISHAPAANLSEF